MTAKRPLFVIDLAYCTGCGTCVIACQDRAQCSDATHWLHLDEIEAGHFPKPTLTYRVRHCFHCAEPQCVDACPSGAILHESQGSVTIDASLCIGCKKCAGACPFGAITLNSDNVATKCDGCGDQVAAERAPVCVRACPMRALQYRPAPDALPPGRVADPHFDARGAGPAVLYLCRPAHP